MPGSLTDPVRLDPWQNITAVSWSQGLGLVRIAYTTNAGLHPSIAAPGGTVYPDVTSVVTVDSHVDSVCIASLLTYPDAMTDPFLFDQAIFDEFNADPPPGGPFVDQAAATAAIDAWYNSHGNRFFGVSFNFITIPPFDESETFTTVIKLVVFPVPKAAGIAVAVDLPASPGGRASTVGTVEVKTYSSRSYTVSPLDNTISDEFLMESYNDGGFFINSDFFLAKHYAIQIDGPSLVIDVVIT